MIKNIPLYPHSYETAKKNGRQEMDAYQASHSANIQCAAEIKEAIDSHYDGAYLAQGCENEIIEKYGFERVNFVLAYNIQQKEYDERISRENKEWASEYHIENDMIDTYSPRNRYIIHTHNGLLDIFTNRVRKAQQLFSDMSQTVTESENLTDEAEEQDMNMQF